MNASVDFEKIDEAIEEGREKINNISVFMNSENYFMFAVIITACFLWIKLHLHEIQIKWTQFTIKY